MDSDISRLSIYKASAGSGKTYRLVLEYLKLVLQNPTSYRHVLAVTFTNKATTEMKERIVEVLWQISTGKKDDMVLQLNRETGMAELDIRTNAGSVLSAILHDYDRFSISTIDSFFQKVLKNFTRELGLHGAFEVELDQDMLIAEACDRILLQIDEDQELANWLIDMSEYQLSTGKDWQLTKTINNLAREVTKEKFLDYLILQPDLAEGRKKIRGLNREIQRYIQWFKNECLKMGKAAMELIQSHGLTTSSFSGGSRSFANYFAYLAQFREDKILQPSDSVTNACNNPEKWITKGKKEWHAPIESIYNGGLNRMLCEALAFVEQHQLKYNTARLITQNIYALGVLSVIMEKMREIGKERNSLLLSESNQLLKVIISDNDAPFVYEKSGTYFHHFMIDEFQDTSETQWHNFKPLITNSLSEGHANLVVGDVKQAIYRWRNGDWRLLGFRLNKELMEYQLSEVSMNSNWRSAPEIVAFNNYLFETLAQLVQDSFNRQLETGGISSEQRMAFEQAITGVFSGVGQVCEAQNLKGEVRVSYFEPDEESGTFKEQSVEALIVEIERLQTLGYQAGDMVVLIRQNNESELITKAIAQKKRTSPVTGVSYELMSEDSLYVANSSLVRFIVAMFNYVLQPWNNVWSSSAIYEFETCLLPKLRQLGHQPNRLIRDGQQEIDFDRQEPVTSLFTPGIVNDYFPYVSDESFEFILKRWSNLNPMALLAELEQVYGLSFVEDEMANLQAFRDIVTEFSLREVPSLFRFIEWWNEKGMKTKLQTGSRRNAITIMTIHKSKGLEFPLVFLPFCSWSFVPGGSNGTIIWCSTQNSDFKQVPVLPINFKQLVSKSQFSEEYYSELLLSYIDNLNLLYVACTRAVEGLYIHTEKKRNRQTEPSQKKDSRNINDLTSLLDGLFIEQFDGRLAVLDEFSFGIGKLAACSPQDKRDEMVELLNYRSRGNQVAGQLKLKINYREFWEIEGKKLNERINHGKIVHEIMSKINYSEDLDQALDTVMISGKIGQDERELFHQKISILMKHPTYNSWFSQPTRILNEADIILPGGELFRPDRVMELGDDTIVVDYKTSAVKRKEHVRQVGRYMSLLQSMGKSRVKGFIWYFETDELIEIGQKTFNH